MKATLITRDKRTINGTITEVVAWKIEKPVPGCNHNFKYRFYFGMLDGTCIIRYDNERGKGDHKHVEGKEVAYIFRSLPQAFRDFNEDKERWLHGKGQRT